jgi:hypothetical protein
LGNIKTRETQVPQNCRHGSTELPSRNQICGACVTGETKISGKRFEILKLLSFFWELKFDGLK